MHKSCRNCERHCQSDSIHTYCRIRRSGLCRPVVLFDGITEWTFILMERTCRILVDIAEPDFGCKFHFFVRSLLARRYVPRLQQQRGNGKRHGESYTRNTCCRRHGDLVRGIHAQSYRERSCWHLQLDWA
jgi:hypothetical protein